MRGARATWQRIRSEWQTPLARASVATAAVALAALGLAFVFPAVSAALAGAVLLGVAGVLGPALLRSRGVTGRPERGLAVVAATLGVVLAFGWAAVAMGASEPHPWAFGLFGILVGGALGCWLGEIEEAAPWALLGVVLVLDAGAVVLVAGLGREFAPHAARASTVAVGMLVGAGAGVVAAVAALVAALRRVAMGRRAHDASSAGTGLASLASGEEVAVDAPSGPVVVVAELRDHAHYRAPVPAAVLVQRGTRAALEADAAHRARVALVALFGALASAVAPLASPPVEIRAAAERPTPPRASPPPRAYGGALAPAVLYFPE